ncbi:alpha/beta fold hydrolase [Nocardia coubleae]|uniref:Alpha/beta hydrolase n=1 Tax=Nocardia coubleae TaxID=356147 RepID=A0A846W628_9NOCA|nr:alpha/beta hydrolase [Nocardia coubleae]NKX88077.1 alpha/beta hydrolase [Nocardia coubleae]
MPVRRDSSVIHFTDTGSGEPIVLSHGFLMDATMFDRTTARLTAAGLRVIAVDARGFGETVSDPDEPFTYWDLADDIASVLDHLDITGPVVLGGMSQGGYTALRFALRYPDRTRALVLASTTARANTVEESAQYRAMATAWTDPAIPLEPQARALAPLLIGGTDADQEHWIRRWLTNPDRPRTTAAWTNLATRDEITPRLPEIPCPALVLRGHADQAGGTADDASALAASLPGTQGLSTVIAGPTAGHAVWWTHPQPVSTAITTFVDRVRRTEQVSSG